MKPSHQTITKIILIALGILILLYFSEPGIIMFDIPPHIKNLLWIIFIISGLLLLIASISNPKPPGPPLPHNLPQPESGISGTVVDYAANGIGDIDKILLQRGNQNIWLHFPPHTAQQVMNVAVKNTTVYATVHNGKMPPHDNRILYELISLRSDALGITINVYDIPPPPPMQGNEVEVKGNSIELKLNDRGEAAAFILSGKLIEFHPHTAETLLPLMKQAHEIIVRGYQRNPSNGFVNNTGLPFIKPYTITIDNINYVIQ
jgi:hypothetical protein